MQVIGTHFEAKYLTLTGRCPPCASSKNLTQTTIAECVVTLAQEECKVIESSVEKHLPGQPWDKPKARHRKNTTLRVVLYPNAE